MLINVGLTAWDSLWGERSGEGHSFASFQSEVQERIDTQSSQMWALTSGELTNWTQVMDPVKRTQERYMECGLECLGARSLE